MNHETVHTIGVVLLIGLILVADLKTRYRAHKHQRAERGMKNKAVHPKTA